MNILFLTLADIQSIEGRGIYKDLLRKFRDEGHHISIVTPVERRYNKKTKLFSHGGVDILQVKTLNIKRTNVIEKGIATLAIEYQYLYAIKRFLKNTKFDLVLYSTPPITLVKVIEYIKKRDNAFSYLLLKDIFPQNAVDIKMMKAGSFLHTYFTKMEKKLYNLSDKIGCMSPANVQFVLRHNPEVLNEKIEVNPNSIEPIEINYSERENRDIRNKYNLPVNRKILVYGGNLGKPQGLDFLIETIEHCKNEQAYFLIVGSGTEYNRLRGWFDLNNPSNAKLLERLPKDDYVKVLAACDIGLIFLHKDFLIPNFPSRLLSYLEMKKPVIAATDPNSDIGDVVQENGCGRKVLAGDINQMMSAIDEVICGDIKMYENNCITLLNREYLVDISYNIILQNFKKE